MSTTTTNQSFTNPSSVFRHKPTTTTSKRLLRFTISNQTKNKYPTTSSNNRRKLLSTSLLAAVAINLKINPDALAEKWGTRSFLKERYFEPGLSPEDAADRIRQTAEGMKSLRHMLDTMSWRYVLFYVRMKSNYLNQDLKNVMTLMPENRLKSYVSTANDLVENMSMLDKYVRTPKVYESYVYYEKSLKSMDEVLKFLA